MHKSNLEGFKKQLMETIILSQDSDAALF